MKYETLPWMSLKETSSLEIIMSNYKSTNYTTKEKLIDF